MDKGNLIIGIALLGGAALYFLNKKDEQQMTGTGQSAPSYGGGGSASGSSINSGNQTFPSISPGGSVINLPSAGNNPNSSSGGVGQGMGGAGAGSNNVGVNPATKFGAGVTQDNKVAQLQTYYGTNTPIVPNYNANPLDNLVTTISGSTYVASRSPTSQAEADAARAANVANLYSRGLMSVDQVVQAGYDPVRLSSAYSSITGAQSAAIGAGAYNTQNQAVGQSYTGRVAPLISPPNTVGIIAPPAQTSTTVTRTDTNRSNSSGSTAIRSQAATSPATQASIAAASQRAVNTGYASGTPTMSVAPVQQRVSSVSQLSAAQLASRM